MEWGLVQPNDIIQAKGKEAEAILLNNGNVLVDDIEMSMQVWLKELYGWASVQTYAFAIDKKTGKTLSELREKHMVENQK